MKSLVASIILFYGLVGLCSPSQSQEIEVGAVVKNPSLETRLPINLESTARVSASILSYEETYSLIVNKSFEYNKQKSIEKYLGVLVDLDPRVSVGIILKSNIQAGFYVSALSHITQGEYGVFIKADMVIDDLKFLKVRNTLSAGVSVSYDASILKNDYALIYLSYEKDLPSFSYIETVDQLIQESKLILSSANSLEVEEAQIPFRVGIYYEPDMLGKISFNLEYSSKQIYAGAGWYL